MGDCSTWLKSITNSMTSCDMRLNEERDAAENHLWLHIMVHDGLEWICSKHMHLSIPGQNHSYSLHNPAKFS